MAKPYLRTQSRNRRNPWLRWDPIRAALGGGDGSGNTERSRSAGKGFVLKAEKGEGALYCTAATFQAKPEAKPSACSLHLCGSGGFFRDRKQ